MTGAGQIRSRLADIVAQSCDQGVRSPSAEALTPAERALETCLTNWFGRLELLYGVPFDYLVPHPAMLPPESLRFFHIDRNSRVAMTAGALSVGVNSTRHDLVNHVRTRALRERIDCARAATRARLRQKPDGETVDGGDILSGFLLRSSLVAGWPGLEVAAFYDPPPEDVTQRKHARQLRIERLDRLAPSLLLCLFSGTRIPRFVELTEPRESFCLGVQPKADAPPEITLRHLKGDLQGQAIPGRTEPVPLRAPQTVGAQTVEGVIDVAKLAGNLTARFRSEGGLSADEAVQSAELAIQMVRAPVTQGYGFKASEGDAS